MLIIFLMFIQINSYSSGGEDGFVRVHYFDQLYFDFELEMDQGE